MPIVSSLSQSVLGSGYIANYKRLVFFPISFIINHVYIKMKIGNLSKC